MIPLDDLIERVRGGDREAFAGVIEACHVPVRALISALVHDRNDADDLAQQAFVFAYQHLAEYQAGTHFLAWLKAIARNHVRDHFKRRSLQKANHLRYLREEITRRAFEIAGPAEADPRIEMLEGCVGSLPDRQRDLLREAHARTGTLEDLAARLHRPADALRKQISRLYEVLRECIDRRLGGAGTVNA
jgi:RNA polymerase sigma-70 factor (ECF subfamily)